MVDWIQDYFSFDIQFIVYPESFTTKGENLWSRRKEKLEKKVGGRKTNHLGRVLQHISPIFNKNWTDNLGSYPSCTSQQLKRLFPTQAFHLIKKGTNDLRQNPEIHCNIVVLVKSIIIISLVEHAFQCRRQEWYASYWKQKKCGLKNGELLYCITIF